MKSTIVIYGSSTGTCEDVAKKIAGKLGCEAVDVQNITADTVQQHDNLILGTSTWGAGDMQDDWFDGVKVLTSAGLQGKTVALFGCGDSESYSDTFCGGIGQLHEALENSGAHFIGAVPASDYTYEDSEAVVDDKFVGLALDDVNESDKTDSRIDNWLKQIEPQL